MVFIRIRSGTRRLFMLCDSMANERTVTRGSLIQCCRCECPFPCRDVSDQSTIAELRSVGTEATAEPPC